MSCTIRSSIVFRRTHLLCALVVFAFFVPAVAVDAEDAFSDALKAVRAVESNGVGNESAVKAMQVLNKASASQIPQMLEAMDGVNKISLNWLRSAVTQAARRESAKIPSDKIQQYFDNHDHHPMGRLLAFDLLTAGDKAKRESMISGLIDDPSLPLRLMAVDQMVGQAEEVMESDPIAATGKLGYAFTKARDVAQIQAIAGKLEALGIEVDLQSQLGFLNTWSLVGNFDNKDMKGFDVPYGPEKSVESVDLTANYQASEGDGQWQKVSSVDPQGRVNLNELVGRFKGSTVYAATTYRSADERDAEIRIGTPNATKIWLNGELVMSNEIYHNSNSIDKFIGKVKLKKGKNEILMKVCQNEQSESWAQDWEFQFRICDSTGKAIPEFVPPSSNN